MTDRRVECMTPLAEQSHVGKHLVRPEQRKGIMGKVFTMKGINYLSGLRTE